ncbi:hypothetical protein BC827DRAFT_1243686 [Russula dissimulans]|nr:hypothetical protein BC827DRAFT_1243686 [Russula dissimulans]
MVATAAVIAVAVAVASAQCTPRPTDVDAAPPIRLPDPGPLSSTSQLVNERSSSTAVLRSVEDSVAELRRGNGYAHGFIRAGPGSNHPSRHVFAIPHITSLHDNYQHLRLCYHDGHTRLHQKNSPRDLFRITR